MFRPKTFALTLASLFLVAALAAPAAAAPPADGPDSPSIVAVALSWLTEQIGWIAPDEGDALVVREKSGVFGDPNGLESGDEPGTSQSFTSSDEDDPSSGSEGAVVVDPHG